MPRANEVFRTSSPIKAKLPTNQFPHLKTLIHELDYACSTCTSGKGYPVYRTVAETLAVTGQPISGPGKYTTRWVLMCPECLTIPEEGPFIMHGIIDLLDAAIPHGYKRPDRGSQGGDNNLFETDPEDDPTAPVLKPAPQPSIARKPRGAVKKTSELHPKTKGTKAKGNQFKAVKAGIKKKARATGGGDLEVGNGRQ